MAVDKLLQRDALPSASDLTDSDKLYTLITINADGKFDTAGVGQYIHGSLYEGAKADDSSTVGTVGLCRVKLGAAVTPGSEISADASGKGRAAVAGDYIFGRARESGGPGVVVAVMITREGIKA